MEADRLQETQKEVQREIGGGFAARKREHKVTSVSYWREQRWREEQRETEVKRFCGSNRSPYGGLDDLEVETWIIRAMLWVSGIIRLVHILNIQWDIWGRCVREQAKGHFAVGRADRDACVW